MSQGDEFTAGFVRWLLGWTVVVMVVIAVLAVVGCSSPAVSEPKYPEYEKWWTLREPEHGNDLGEPGRGGILAFDAGREAVLP